MRIIKADGTDPISLADMPTTVQNAGGNLKKQLKANIRQMAKLQNMLYAQDKYALLIIFQAMDAAGKDSMIRRVMTGLNPQGTQVFSFKQPGREELDHDYLWKAHQRLPERGRIGIFNRSYYEEVLVVRVHDLIKQRRIPAEYITDDIWTRRFAHIRGFEEYIGENGTVVLKFFLHISKDVQKQRFLERINNPEKNWKFSEADLQERVHWDEYLRCYEDAINNTATAAAPWYVIPADDKWSARLMVSRILVDRMMQMKLKYPVPTNEQMENIAQYKKLLD